MQSYRHKKEEYSFIVTQHQTDQTFYVTVSEGHATIMVDNISHQISSTCAHLLCYNSEEAIYMTVYSLPLYLYLCMRNPLFVSTQCPQC